MSDKTKTKERQRHSPEVRRQMIIDAAYGVAHSQGIARATMREIATAAGVSTGTVTYHFESVEDLLVEVLRTALRKHWGPRLAQLEERRTALEGLVILIDASIDEYGEEDWLIFLEFFTRSMHEPFLLEWATQRYRRYRRKIASLIEDGIKQDEFRPSDDPTQLAVELGALIEGLGIAIIADSELSRDVAWIAATSFLVHRLGCSADEIARLRQILKAPAGAR